VEREGDGSEKIEGGMGGSKRREGVGNEKRGEEREEGGGEEERIKRIRGEGKGRKWKGMGKVHTSGGDLGEGEGGGT